MHSAALTFVALVIALIGSAVSAQEARPAGEWLEIVQGESARQKAEEIAGRTALLRSAAMVMHPYDGRPFMLAKPGRAARFAPYREWLEGRGRELYLEWRRTGQMPEAAAADRWLLEGLALYRQKRKGARPDQGDEPFERDPWADAYVEGVIKAGQAALRGAYLAGELTPSALEDLRRYAMYVDLKCTGGRVLPFHLGLSRSERFELGGEAPDFTLMRAEVPLESPDYSDLNPHDPTDVFRPAILSEYLLLAQGYEPDGEGGVRPRPVEVPAGREGDYVTLSSFRGRKPVLLVLANPTDVWAWHWSIAPIFEPLRRACGDRVEFLFINTTIHDTYMPVMDYFGPEPGRHDAVHDLTLEQRPRVCKLFHMFLPQCTVPYLLDGMAQRTRNAYMDQGGGAYIVLVDLDGRIAYLDYHQDIPPHWGPNAVSFRDEYVYIRMNHLDSRLAAFLDNGSRYDPSIETPYPAWRRPPLLKGVQIVAVDAGAGTVTVAAGDGGEPRVVRVASGTRIEIDYEVAAAAELQAGDTADVSLQPGAEAVARSISVIRDQNAARGRRQTIWMSGTVSEVDTRGGVLVAERNLAPEDELIGLRYWQEAGDRATAFDPLTRARLEAVERWLAAPDAQIRFAIDDAVTIFLNGHQSALSELQPGDAVGISYRAFRDGRPTILPEQIRAYRLGL